MFDKDRGGTISISEIKEILSFGGGLPQVQLDELVQQVEEFGDGGEITYNQYLRMLGLQVEEKAKLKDEDLLKRFML